MFRQTRRYISFNTAEAGLLQSKAHRVLTAFMTSALAKHNLSLPQWALLGLLADCGQTRPTDVADTLGVKPPVATKLLNELENKKLLVRTKDLSDSRAAVIHLTKKGSQLVKVVERQLRVEMRTFLSDIKVPELLTYINVLNKLAKKM
jgi:DNA-binding MarR family transcriptional regulator